MTDFLEEQDDASTPLTDEEREDLIPSYITLRSELNEAEQANILEAEEWAFARKRDVLDAMVPLPRYCFWTSISKNASLTRHPIPFSATALRPRPCPTSRWSAGQDRFHNGATPPIAIASFSPPGRRRLPDSEHAAIAATIADYSPSLRFPWLAANGSLLIYISTCLAGSGGGRVNFGSRTKTSGSTPTGYQPISDSLSMIVVTGLSMEPMNRMKSQRGSTTAWYQPTFSPTATVAMHALQLICC